MDTIILVGGKGTRLRETIGDDIPKPLAKINGTPFLDLIISQLEKFDIIKNIILAVGYKKEKIIDRYKDKNNILFSEDFFPLGTGGAIKKALSLCKSNEVLVLNGDTYLEFNLADLLQNHIEKKAEITIGYRFEKDTSRYGSLTLDEKTKKILKFNEKQNSEKLKEISGFINSGVYVINKNVFDDFENIEDSEKFSIELDFFSKAVFTKKIFGFDIKTSFIDIGTASSYHRAQNILNLG
ncbi:MAG: D-glycero-alpha-D-manno-heptose 1-phosphate guanylyltransferase [Candidatus Anoxychlamydiales bacterium]|nr:D-glycero-alpha-D-manno-heptose 1-phosphate guanylyltransferase [Candidatus Anoxychlamydiales bacterium]